MAKVLVALFLILGVCTLGSAHANIVNNGGFETGDLTGWTASGETGGDHVNVGGRGNSPHSGSYSVNIGSTGPLGYITQDLNTIAGATYTLSFWLQNQAGPSNEFVVNWGGITLIGGDVK